MVHFCKYVVTEAKTAEVNIYASSSTGISYLNLLLLRMGMRECLTT